MKRLRYIEIIWRYEPLDFFEAPASLNVGAGTLKVASGEATLIVPASEKPDARAQRDQATAEVERVFDARSLLTGRAYILRHHGYYSLDDQDRRSATLFPDPIVTTMQVFSPSIVTVDASGRAIADPNAERLVAEEQYVQDLAARCTASTLVRQMMASYRRSLEDPANALIHLYEVRDAAVRYYGGAASARQQLGVSTTEWSRLGQLANDEPIREGRHRGKSDQPLRDATAAELAKARSVAKRIIDAAAAMT